MIKIEAVTVCVDYGDYLEQIAPHNRRLLDRWVVVTKPSDWRTREVCSKHSIECVLSNDFYRDGNPFAKSRGINAGLRQLTGDGYLLHNDADICLPFDLHECLKDANIQPGNIYGCNRLCVPGKDTWKLLQNQGLYSRYNGWLAEFRDRPEGCYVGGIPAGIGNGYCPIGFFQLWWGDETLSFGHSRKWYPLNHGTAARTDTQFASLWDRNNRIMIPELMVFHLEDPDAKNRMGQNWKGRVSPDFNESAQSTTQVLNQQEGY